MAKVTIIGAGAMGGALTVPLVENGHTVNLWGTELDKGIIDNLRNGMRHPKHKCNLPSEVKTFYVNQLDKAMENTDLVIMAITSDALRKIFKRVIPYLHEGMIVGSVSKGFERNNKGEVIILPEMMKGILPDTMKNKISFVVVGGPCKAIEVIWKSPTWVTYSSEEIENAKYMQNILNTSDYRVEVNRDVIGTEVCAAMKNAYAISLGIAEGFKNRTGFFHKNAKGALFTSAVKEMGILTEALGGNFKSVVGLSGIGDLELTGEAGRNRMLGEVMGEGLSGKAAIEKMNAGGITVEGYQAVKLGVDLVKQLEAKEKLSIKDMPLLNNLYGILYEDKPSYETITKLS